MTALLGLPTGFAIGWFTCQLLRGPRVVIESRFSAADGSLLAQIAQRAHSLTRQVRTRLGRHQADLRVAHAELRAGDISVVERIVCANESLLEQLADAEEQFVSQEFAIQQHLRDASHDSLTSLENRRAFDKELAERFSRWQADTAEFCLVLIDVDHFKRINDEYGHPIGDAVLKAIANAFTACARPEDSVCRLGGEEFGILLASCTLEQGWHIVDRLRHAIADHPIPAGSAMLRLTVSLGIASVRSVQSADDLVSQADRALYSAKEAGRNRAYFYSGAGYDPVHVCSAQTA